MLDFAAIRLRILLSAFAAIFLATASDALGSDSPKLVNLARLSIARVSAGPDPGRPPDAIYGVHALFDGGSSVVNGINYSYWLSEGSNWVLVRFTRPVTVNGLMVVVGQFESYSR